MLKLIAIIALAIPLWAEDIYVAQSATGGDTGVSCADAHSAAWFNDSANWGGGAGEIDPGDTAHFCGTLTSPVEFQASGTSGSPITLLFEADAKFSAANWGVTGTEIVSSFSADPEWVIVDGGSNGLIEATDNGSSPTYSTANNYTAVSLGRCDNCIVRNLTIRNIFVKDTDDSQGEGGGIALKGSNNQVYNNTIHNMKICLNVSFNSGATVSGTRVYDNTLSHCNHLIMCGDGGVNATLDDLQIYNNDISDPYNWDDNVANSFHHNGIHIWATFSGSSVTNLQIYGNYFHGNWGSRTTAAVYLESTGGPNVSPLIYNNIFTDTAADSSPSNGFVSMKESVTDVDGGSRLYNNVFYHSTVGGLSLEIQGETELFLNNNIFWNNSNAFFLPDGGTIAVSDYNVFYGNTAIAPGSSALSDWQTNMSQDANSLASDPELNSTFHAISVSSPAVDAGTSISGIFSIDKDGASRPIGVAWDIGAYEFDSSPPAATITGAFTLTGGTIQ